MTIFGAWLSFWHALSANCYMATNQNVIFIFSHKMMLLIFQTKMQLFDVSNALIWPWRVLPRMVPGHSLRVHPLVQLRSEANWEFDDELLELPLITVAAAAILVIISIVIADHHGHHHHCHHCLRPPPFLFAVAQAVTPRNEGRCFGSGLVDHVCITMMVMVTSAPEISSIGFTLFNNCTNKIKTNFCYILWY